MSVYEAIGGSGAVRAVVDQFYARVLTDSRVQDIFKGTDVARLKSHQRAFIGAAIGGPQLYTGRDVASAHASLHITDADFDVIVGHLVDTLAELGVPAEYIAQIGATLAPLRGQIVTQGAAEAVPAI
ncbi:group I truncated hemoglobin [Dactylosporangium matsuzakiense]|uniref:Group 1 truncated hemoglobin n=1 Tax=Dactylosporangium matsuzakiense TaxID=53360 RepID=A0A9W6KNC0_9ACTN|nr:group 1 truncated hemoglobin [Dactylosporangium matsuzakiense]GLL04613.1 hypothetical protein GCM10017581_063600 [Dactylosporangium matsuzakiense]